MSMKKILILILLAGCLTVAGCRSGQTEDEKGVEMTINENKTDDSKNPVENLYSLLMEDEAGDKRSVNWDGESATMIDDELDSFDIVDGRSVSEGSKTYTVDMLIECVYPADFEQVDVDENEPDKCHFISKDDEIYVQQISYADEISRFKDDDNYIEIDSLGIREDMLKYFKDYKTFVGIKEINGVKKAGYVLLFESALADRSYKIEVYGLGNMSIITQEALFVMNQFWVLFY